MNEFGDHLQFTLQQRGESSGLQVGSHCVAKMPNSAFEIRHSKFAQAADVSPSTGLRTGPRTSLPAGDQRRLTSAATVHRLLERRDRDLGLENQAIELGRPQRGNRDGDLSTVGYRAGWKRGVGP